MKDESNYESEWCERAIAAAAKQAALSALDEILAFLLATYPFGGFTVAHISEHVKQIRAEWEAK